ncbi:MAG: UDP-N-acetylglucosamine--N-acetylmuramyl-(pentapeptide) pyrophosphoryl-undecaprenol N-acetylglucosamine transferase [Campylobacteraceae bacterium]|jgi:UDP-N-acetylglucosamine--N-acetylmuramyl-(pentapeptide) pyrophosphoryl-undecaprenol N-acetylglucosamine transferase|nr:UDP-N-acetylglucosamine--N-acetylmuramyl-(pentapeptide) pyrophosphoryl-undecaprenol N-acetylglucosamine transferase [Campylobacteraceae bacterium]
MIAITGGGTGGHLSVAKAIAKEYNKIGIKPLYIGSTNGQDKSWFENSPLFYKTIFLSSYGVVNQGFLGKIKSLANIIKLSFKVKKILKEEGVEKVFSVGGYSSAAASFAAILSFIPIFIHEQNAYMGRLNKTISFFAKEIFSSYDKNSKVKDYPVSDEWFGLQKKRDKLKTVAFLGGSQGAKFINDLALEVALWLNENGIKIVHQTGKNEYEKIKGYYKENSIDADVFDFYSPLCRKLENVDFALSRSGAGSMWELAAAKIPTLFIPYPHAAKNHQYFNAKILENKNAAILIKQSDMSAKILISVLCDADIVALNSALEGAIEPNGAKKIVEMIENYDRF